ncbi:MAG TPA: hypothetical protein VGI16_04240 [Candidatus Acidoferrum sp.]|jgi:hypothetical protein
MTPAQNAVASIFLKTLLSTIFALFLCGAAHAQTTQSPVGTTPPMTAPIDTQYPVLPANAVSLKDEPHHRLVLSNEFVKAYLVSVQPNDTTLLHQHDLPYLYVDLGNADFINAVQGKPEAHVTQADGDSHFSPGKFAHLVRTDAGLPFKNVTMELLHPQNNLRNLCRQVAPAGATAGACPIPDAANKSLDQISSDRIPYFESDEVLVEVMKVSGEHEFSEAEPRTGALLVALSNSNLNVSLAGEHITFLHEGDVVWLPAGKSRKVVDFLGTRSNFMLVSFKDATAAAK